MGSLSKACGGGCATGLAGLLTRCAPTAVPFEEDDKDPTIWFLDHSYLENMFRMFKKVNGKPETSVGRVTVVRTCNVQQGQPQTSGRGGRKTACAALP